ncbi:MAG: hypothetical protein HYY95_22785 [Candidatus Rokubacteria bacterium]|nr:hypothetical protein [Candidatus Rokubacteria bacterium]
MKAADESAAFARLVLALRPYLGDLVLIGGWAQRLFRLHPWAQPAEFPPLLTQDVDVAIPKKLSPRAEGLRTLLRTAGFTERFFGEDHPPVTHYQLGDDATFYVEFLTPLVGPPKTSTSSVAGVAVQHLRHLAILMIEPWSISLSPPAYPLGSTPIEVRIANATGYLAQKLLVLDKRNPDDRAKDILYIHDTLLTFGRSLADLERLWIDRVAPGIHRNAARMLRGSPGALFSQTTDPARAASRVATAAGRPVTPEEIAAVCRTGLARVFT